MTIIEDIVKNNFTAPHWHREWEMLWTNFWTQVLVAFLHSYIYRVPGGDGVKLRPIDGWQINPYVNHDVG